MLGKGVCPGFISWTTQHDGKRQNSLGVAQTLFQEDFQGCQQFISGTAVSRSAATISCSRRFCFLVVSVCFLVFLEINNMCFWFLHVFSSPRHKAIKKKYCDIHNEGGPVLLARNDRAHCKDYCGVVEMSISAPELWEAPESPSVPYSVNLPHPAVCVRSAKLLRLLCFFHIPAGGVFCLINKIELPICLVWAIIVKQLNPTVIA